MKKMVVLNNNNNNNMYIEDIKPFAKNEKELETDANNENI